MDVLFHRSVKFIDQGQTRHETITSVYKALPRLWESEDAEEQRLSTLDAAVARHDAAAAAVSRTNTTSNNNSVWRKEPVTFAGADAGYYRKLLDGVDPVLPPHLAAAPAVNSLTLRLSWLPSHYAATGFIASAHDSLLALCVGSYRDRKGYSSWRNLPWFYLVLDTRAKSVAVVPPLPYSWGRFANDGDSESEHFPLGSAGVAVLRTGAHDGADGGGYLLAELYRHTDQDEFPTNKATLFTWGSPGSADSGGGPRAGDDQWTRKEVVLPLPDPDEDGYSFNFNPETVFAVSSNSLCWVDVWAGILICDNISSRTAADAGDDDDGDGLVFRFIPLPEDCAPAYMRSTEYRSVCCVDPETIKLLCMDDGGGEVTAAVTTWTLRSPLSADGGWRWEKDEDASCASLCVADLLDDAIPVDGGGGGGKQRRLLRRVARWPVVGRERPGVAHVTLHDFEFNRRENEWEATGLYEVSLDVARRRVASVFTFPAGSSSPGHMVMTLNDVATTVSVTDITKQ